MGHALNSGTKFTLDRKNGYPVSMPMKSQKHQADLQVT